MTTSADLPLSPTPRTTVGRLRERAQADREALFSVLREGMVAHVGLVSPEGHPVVLPTTYAVDADGPDEGGTLYVHGSVAARWLRQLPESQVCVTVTLLDGLVLARSGFHHSMNYRSAVVMGRPRLVEDVEESDHALWLIVDHLVPGRSATLRAHTRKELAATAVVALPLAEASVKARAGGPNDDEEDIAEVPWAGHLPLRVVADAPVVSPDATTSTVPEDVAGRARALGAEG